MSLARAEFTTHGISSAEEAVRNKSTGQISNLDQAVAMADYVLKNLHEYETRPYPMLPAMLQDYAQARKLKVRQYDNGLFKKLVEWNLLLVETHLKNQADLGMVKWAIEATRAVGLLNQTNRLERLVDRYAANTYPRESAMLAVAAQYVDASARMEKTKERV